jgi:hypothetical protein
MVQPRNYSIKVQSPLQAFGQAAQFGAGLAEMDARRQAQQQEAVRQESLNQEIQRVNAIASPTAADFRTLSFLLPKDRMDSVRSTFELGTKEQQENQLSFSGKVLSAFTAGQPQVGINLLETRATAEENAGRPEQAKAYRTYAELAKVNPNSARTTIGMMLASVPGGDKVIEATTKAQLAPIQVSEAQAKERARLMPAQPKPGFRAITPEERTQFGLPANIPFIVGPDGKVEEIKVSAPAKADFRVLTPAENVERGLPPDVRYQMGSDGKISPITPGPLVTVDTGEKRGETALKELDIPRAKEFSDSAASARRLAQDSRVIANLLEGKSGGAVVKLTTELARNLGFSTETVTANDLVNALATRGAVQIRAPGSGATSDLEFKSYLAAFPSLSNSAKGRELMAKYAEAFAKRSARLADHSRKLIREDRYSEEEIARFDESLGTLLDKDFYDFAKLNASRRPGVQAFPGTAPATVQPRTPAPAVTPPAAAPAAPATAAPTSPSTVRRLRWNPQTQRMEAR